MRRDQQRESRQQRLEQRERIVRAGVFHKADGSAEIKANGLIGNPKLAVGKAISGTPAQGISRWICNQFEPDPFFVPQGLRHRHRALWSRLLNGHRVRSLAFS